MSRIFLSYGHADGSAVAEQVRAFLVADGQTVWQDAERIRAGWSWTEEIRQGLRDSQVLIALLSPHSVRLVGNSPDATDSVCLQEISYAVDACRIPVVPVMVVTCEPPFRIFDLQYLDFRKWGESDAVSADLCRSLGAAVTEAVKNGRSPRRDWGWQQKPWDFGPFLTEKREGFIGREWFFARVNEWLARGKGPALLVTGRPGVGKSAIVAELVHRNQNGQVLAFYCCQADTPATLEPAGFVRSLSATLAARIEAYAAMLQNIDVREALSEVAAAKDPAAAFEAGVLSPLAKLPPQESVRYILIDALDESLALQSKPTIVDVLATRLRRLPGWLRIVATTRPEPAVLNKLRGLHAIQISAEDPDNQRDVSAFVDRALASPDLRLRVERERRSTAEIQKHMLEASEWNFLFVRTALDAITTGQATFKEILALPPGMGSLYGIFFERLYANDEAAFEPARRVLQAIVAAQRPPTQVQLAEVTKLDEDEELPGTMTRLSSFITFREERYALFHRSLFEWLTGLDDGQPLAGPYYASLQGGHRRWADWCEARYAEAQGSPVGYALEYLCTHLAEARRWEALIRALSDWRFLESRVASEGSSVFALQSEFRLAMARLPAGEARDGLLPLLADIVRFDGEFISQHPDTLFQCCWNRGWWHDARQAAFFWELAKDAPASAQAPWRKSGSTLFQLIEAWRAAKEKAQPGLRWLRAVWPMEERLGGSQTAVLRVEGDVAGKLDVSPDSARLLVTAAEGTPYTVKLWDTESGAPIAERNLGRRAVCGAKFSPDGTIIAVGASNRLLLLDAVTLDQVTQIPLPKTDVCSIAYSPDGRFVGIGDAGGRVGIVQVEERKLREIVPAHTGDVEALAFSPDGRFLASGSRTLASEKDAVVLWRYADRLEQEEQYSTRHWVESIVFSPGGSDLVWGDYDGNIEVHHLATRKSSHLREPHGRPAAALAFLPNGRLVCGGGGVEGHAPISILNASTGAVERVLRGHVFGISDLVVYRDGRALASAGDATIRLWSLDAAVDLADVVPREPDVSCIEFSRHRDVLYSGHEESERVWCRSLIDGEPLLQLLGHMGGVRAITESVDGRLLACATGDGSVRLWNAVTGEPAFVCPFHTEPVEDVAFSADGTCFASGGDDGKVCIGDVASGKRVAVFKEHASVRLVTFSPDGRFLASHSFDRTVIRDLRRRVRPVILAGTRRTIFDLCFTPDSQVLIAQEPGSLSAWDVVTGKELKATQQHWKVFRVYRGDPVGHLAWIGESRGPEKEPTEQRSMTLVSLSHGKAVACLPIVGGEIRGAPSGRTWINRRGTQLWAFRLESVD